MEIGSGIAIAGIWVAVAVVGYKNPAAGILVALFAVLGTLAVVGAK